MEVSHRICQEALTDEACTALTRDGALDVVVNQVWEIALGDIEGRLAAVVA